MKKFTLLASLALAFLSNSISAQVEILGNKEFGRIFEVTYSTKEQNIVYASTINNHILISKDNGVNWNVLKSFPSSMGDITKMNISKDGNLLTFSTIKNSIGEIHVFNIATRTIIKTFELPNAWEAPYVAAYNFFGNDTDNLIVSSQFQYGLGTANRVYVTNDGGLSWREIYYSVEDNQNIITSEVAFGATDKNKIYLANGNGSEGSYGGLMISADGGNTFVNKLEGSVLGTMEFNPNNPDEMYVGTGISFGASPEKLHHSTDGGNTWKDEPVTFGTNGILNNILAIKYNPLDNNNIIVLEEDEIITTTDGGATWKSVEYPYDSLDSYYYGLKASFNPFKAGELFITGNYKPLFSTDNGSTLTQIKTPFFSATGRVSLFENNNAKHLYYSVQNGFVHKNMTDNTEIAYEIQPLNIFSTNNNPAYIPDSKKEGRIYSYKGGFSGSTLAMSGNFGAEFTPIYSTFTSGLTNIIPDPQISNQVYATFSNWGQGELSKINFNNPEDVISTNISLPTQGSVYKILHPNNLSDEFFMLIGSELYKTTNGGTDWTAVTIDATLPEETAILDISQNPKNTNQLTLGTSAGVYISNDKGATWSQSSDFVCYKVSYSDVNDGVLVAATYSAMYTNFNIFYSVDNGATWKTVNRQDFLEAETTSIAIDFSDAKAYIYINSFDMGLIGYNLPLEILASSETSANQAQIKVYPNPVSDVLHIENKNLKSAALYSMDGKKLMETQSSELNVSSLPKGVYMVRLVTSEDKILSKKVIKK